MGDGTGEEVKMVNVDLFGKSYSMTEADAATAIAGRDAATKSFNEAVSLNEAKEAATKKAEDDAKLADEKRIAEEAAKNGELDQLKNLHAADVAKRDSQLKKLTISSAIGQHEGIARTALPDIATSLSADSNISLTDGTLLVKKGDGTTQAFGDYLSGWLTERPHYTVQKGAPPSGSGNEDPPDTSVETMKKSEYDKLSGHKAQEVAMQLSKGTLKIID